MAKKTGRTKALKPTPKERAKRTTKLLKKRTSLRRATVNAIERDAIKIGILETKVIDTALDFVQAWVEHPRLPEKVGPIHGELIRVSMNLVKMRREVAAASEKNAASK